MNKSRKQNKNLVGSLYRRVYGFDMDRCAYCNDLRQNLDHVPPLSVAVNLDLEEAKKDKIKLLLYPCCNYCNQILGSRKLYTYEERLMFLYNHTIRKIKTENKLWSLDEIKEHGPNLKQMVVADRNKQIELAKRLEKYEQSICNLPEVDVVT